MYLLSITFAAVIIVLIGEFIESKKKRKKKFARKFFDPQWMRYCGLLVVAIGAYIGDHNAAEYELLANEQRVLAAKQQSRIETLNVETRAIASGGQSLAVVQAVLLQDDPRFFRINASHGGDQYAAYDIRFEFLNAGSCDRVGFLNDDNSLVVATIYDRATFIQSLGIGSIVSLDPVLIPYPTCEEAYYAILIQTRAASYFQQLVLRKKDGKWSQSVRTFDAETFLLRQDTDQTTFNKILGKKATQWPSFDRAKADIASRKVVDTLGIIRQDQD